MVINHNRILEQLKKLDTVLGELNQHQDIQPVTLHANISQR